MFTKKQEASPVVNRRIEGGTCPKCQGGRIYFDFRPGKIVKDGPHGYITVREETSRACLECWHKW